MAPEVLQGREADARSDIFSFGCVLYEMVTGKRAFDGKTQLSVASAILEREPTPLSTALPLAPPALEHAIRRCLAKDPEQRWQTARDLGCELKWIAGGTSQGAAIVPNARRMNWRERALWGFAGLLVLATVLLGDAYFHQPQGSKLAVRSSILPPPYASFLYGSGTSGEALSPDGSRLAFTAKAKSGKVRLWVQLLNALNAQEFAGTDDATFPFWSPDGQWIAFFAQGKLRRISSSGGPVQEICDASSGRGGTWNSKGEIVFSPSLGSPLVRVSVNGGVPTPVTQLDAALGESSHRWPSFLPDGEHFLYLARQIADNQPSAVYVGSLHSLNRKKIMDLLTEAYYASGYLFFVRNSILLAQPFDPGKLSLGGEPSPVAGDVAAEVRLLRSGFDVSPGGQLVYKSASTGIDSELVVVDRSGKQISTLPMEVFAANLRLSPDDRTLAGTEVLPTSGSNLSLWLFGLQQNTRTRFTFANGFNVSPVWSPDGTQIAYCASGNGIMNIYMKPTTGVADEKPLHPSTDDERPLSFSPDGRFLVLDRRLTQRVGKAEIALLSLSGDGKISSFLNAPYSNGGGQVSPDGRWLAYYSTETGRSEIYVTSFPEAKGKWQVSSGGGSSPRWRRDGAELYFAGDDGVLMVAQIKAGNGSFVVGSVKPLWEPNAGPDLFEGQFAPFADGQRFIVSAIKPGAIHAPLTLLNNWPAELKK
jgi:Tol biopolymer transport system component